MKHIFCKAIFILLTLTIFSGLSNPVQAANTWVYVTTFNDGSTLWYDSDSVLIDRSTKKFDVQTCIIYSYDGKKAEIEYAKKQDYYTEDIENVNFLIDKLSFNYGTDQYFFTEWSYCANDGREIYRSYGPDDNWHLLKESEYNYFEWIYDTIRNDYNLY